ncbi:MAG: hypothetical protein P4L35_08925 [Ignavibacteriaceae bacterium]|nr:hypothetical protein [Ignavibacteriaceae bacterium]MDR3666951.1 hypothetical protein [Ignavibacteriaceae bacterium]
MFQILSRTYHNYQYFISYVINGEYQKKSFWNKIQRDQFIADTRDSLRG